MKIFAERHHRMLIVLMILTCAPFISNSAESKKKPSASKSRKTLAATKLKADPKTVYKDFNQFCRTHYGAEKESLVYTTFGKALSITKTGSWQHVSRQSAVFAFETNLPAMSSIEYGTSKKFTQKTAEAERHFYIHVHHLKNLKPNTSYYYQTVVTDERGNKVIGNKGTFKTAPVAGAIVLNATTKTPIALNKEGATYILSQDLKSDGTAFEISASGITLDLGGHTVTFGSFGVHGSNFKKLKLVNGFIHQNAASMAGNKDSKTFNPIHLSQASDVEVAGISIRFDAPQAGGMVFDKPIGSYDLHHNVFLDRGTVITNRHGSGSTVLWFGADQDPKGKSRFKAHHNLLKRARQNGFRFIHEIKHNEIYIDSWSTNSFATGSKNEDCETAFNRIFLTGYHAIAIPWSTKNFKAHGNFIHMESIRTRKTRWWESFGDQDSMNGLRLTQYGKGGKPRNDLHWYDNVIVGKLRDGAQMRGTEFFSDNSVRNLVCENTTIKIEVEDEQTIKAACVVAQGQFRKLDTLPLYYKNCTLISNICNVRFGDDYGKGLNHRFINCTFLKTGQHAKYHTFVFGGTYWNFNHVILDATFGPGTAYNDVWWYRTGKKSAYTIKWTLSIKGKAGAKVTIKDKNGKVEFSGKMGKDGKLAVPLSQCRLTPPENYKWQEGTLKRNEIVLTPHSVSVEINGRTTSKTVTMDAKKALSL